MVYVIKLAPAEKTMIYDFYYGGISNYFSQYTCMTIIHALQFSPGKRESRQQE